MKDSEIDVSKSPANLICSTFLRNVMTYLSFPNIFKGFNNYPHIMILSHSIVMRHEHIFMTDPRFLWSRPQCSLHSGDALSFQSNLLPPMSW